MKTKVNPKLQQEQINMNEQTKPNLTTIKAGNKPEFNIQRNN